MMSNNTPKQKKAAIFPAGGILLISNTNSLIKVMENKVNEIIRKLRALLRMPNHISANDDNPHNMGKPTLM